MFHYPRYPNALWDTFILPLSYHDPAMERTGNEIHSFSRRAIMTRPWRGLAMRYIHSPAELSWPGHGEDRQWDTFILPPSYHDPAMERTDSEIHSFSHWAIMTRAMERTDSERHSFSHWAAMTDYPSYPVIPAKSNDTCIFHVVVHSEYSVCAVLY